MRAALTSLWLAVALLLPAVAEACPQCIGANEANRLAFIWTALGMTAAPLCMIAAAVYWIRRLVKQRDLEELAEVIDR
jgi:hypothetical protein